METVFIYFLGKMAANSEQVLVALMQNRSHVTYSELGSKLRAGVKCSNANPKPHYKFRAWSYTLYLRLF